MAAKVIIMRDGGGVERHDIIAVDFNVHGTSEQRDAEDKALAVLEIFDPPGEPLKRAVTDLHGLPDFEKGARAASDGGVGGEAQGVDFHVRDGQGPVAGADEAENAGHGDDGLAIAGVEAQEDVAGEERSMHDAGAVRPEALLLVHRDEFFVATLLEAESRSQFPSAPDLKGQPLMIQRFEVKFHELFSIPLSKSANLVSKSANLAAHSFQHSRRALCHTDVQTATACG